MCASRSDTIAFAQTGALGDILKKRFLNNHDNVLCMYEVQVGEPQHLHEPK